MKKQKRILIMSILLVLILLGILLSLLFVKEEPPEEVPEDTSSVQLMSLKTDEINTVTITNPMDQFTLVNCGDSFAVEGMESVKTSSLVVNDLTSLLASLESYRAIEGGENQLSQYGLDNSQYNIQIITTDQQEKQLKLGNPAPDGHGVYGLYEGKVYLIDASILDIAMKDRYSFLDNEITGMEPEYKEATIILSGKERELPITLQITTTEAGSTQEGVKSHGEKHFALTTPLEQEITAESASEATKGLFSLYANAIEAVDPSEDEILSFGLEDPYSQVSVSIDGEESFTLKASQPDDENYVYMMKEGGNLVYLVSAGRLGWMDLQVEQLTQSIYKAPPVKDISKLEIKARGSDYSFEATDKGVSCQEVPVDEKRFQEFYEIVTTIAPEGMYHSRPDFEPAFTMTIISRGGQQDILEMIPIGDGRVALSLNGQIRYSANQQLIYDILDNCRSLMEGGSLEPLA